MACGGGGCGMLLAAVGARIVTMVCERVRMVGGGSSWREWMAFKGQACSRALAGRVLEGGSQVAVRGATPLHEARARTELEADFTAQRNPRRRGTVLTAASHLSHTETLAAKYEIARRSFSCLTNAAAARPLRLHDLVPTLHPSRCASVPPCGDLPQQKAAHRLGKAKHNVTIEV